MLDYSTLSCIFCYLNVKNLVVFFKDQDTVSFCHLLLYVMERRVSARLVLVLTIMVLGRLWLCLVIVLWIFNESL